MSPLAPPRRLSHLGWEHCGQGELRRPSLYFPSPAALFEAFLPGPYLGQDRFGCSIYSGLLVGTVLCVVWLPARPCCRDGGDTDFLFVLGAGKTNGGHQDASDQHQGGCESTVREVSVPTAGGSWGLWDVAVGPGE